MAKWMAVLAAVVLFGTAACNDGGVTTADPTPTPGPTPTATPGSGDLWLISVTPPQQACNVGTTTETFTVNSVKIDISGGTFTPDWGFASQPSITVLDPPHGTVTGNNFAATWTWCGLDLTGTVTTRHVWNWQGTLAGNDTTMTSTISEVLTNAVGDQRSSCASVSTPMGDCTSPGLTFDLTGTHT